jgi:uncharacterized protein YdeI (YjbR/CyaY-like superfamily)
MSELELSKIESFATPIELGEWLKLNHALESSLWIKIYKKNSGIQSVTWNDVVVEALCWGWIDGIKKSVDDHAYIQRITPRKPRSIWSLRNTQHAERLINEGRMMAPGLIHIQTAKQDGRWVKAYVVSEMEVPLDFLTELKHKPKAQAFFNTLTKSNRYVIAQGLLSAKKPETRQRRFDKFMGMLGNEEKPK